MDDTLTIDLLPAMHGDAILLTWGPLEHKHRMMIDGGPAGAYSEVRSWLAELDPPHLDLLVLTHVDADHIEGAILLANDAGLALEIDEVWFNGPAQLSDELSAAQGEMFAALVGARKIPLNTTFKGNAVARHDDEPLPFRDLPGRMRLTVLGPSTKSLRKLRDAWAPTCEDEGLNFASAEGALQALQLRRALTPEDPYLGDEAPGADVTDLADLVVPPDSSVTNESSIVLLAEYGGHALLLAGDATPQTLDEGVHRILDERGVESLDLTVFKVPHHGSIRNVSAQLLRTLPADNYLFSSDGSRFGHPDPGGVARCLVYGKDAAELVFNYRTPQTLRWDDPDLLAGATIKLPEEDQSGLRLSFPVREST